MKIEISIADQTLDLFDDSGKRVERYRVSTAANGAGEQSGSYRTPRGLHVVRAKIGAGAPSGAVFAGRRPTGEVWTPQLAEQFPGRDWILTRILWLSGKQPGFNRLGKVDTMRRYIYIHGTPENESLGIPGSHGCVRMSNTGVADLFERIALGTPVFIRAPN